MKKNKIEIRITGLDFLQDVEPLVKEFFPDFEYERDVVICLDTGTDGFSGRVSPASGTDGFGGRALPASGTDGFGGRALSASGTESVMIGEEKIFFSSDNDLKIRHRDYRNQLLRALYRALKTFTHKELPWGILTGVRPTKLLFERIGHGEENHVQYMVDNYYCSESKASLAASVALREYELLEKTDYRNGYSLYVGIPFCPSICNYCTFGSHPLEKFGGYVEPYLNALEKEIRFAADMFGQRKLNTVYFGGGTPTAIGAEQLRGIIRLVRECFRPDEGTEFTVEAGRPDSITAEKLTMLKEEGISRISINPQTFSDRTLSIIGRNHTSAQVYDSFRLARKLGFDNINMDLIAGLTGEDEKDFRHTLECVGELAPDAITVHTLAHKRAARITTDPYEYEGYLTSGVDKMLEMSFEFMKENSYLPYYMYRQKNMTDNLENVGYSKPGKEGLYNILIMEEVQPILALGAGASSKFVRKTDGRFGRVENVKNVREYIDRIDEMLERKRAFPDGG